MLKAVACTTVLVGTLLLGTAALAQEQNFTLVNNTGHVVVTLNISPASEARWGPDVLAAQVLANGESAEIKFEAPENTCLWDLRVTYGDGDTGEWRQVDLCQNKTVTLAA